MATKAKSVYLVGPTRRERVVLGQRISHGAAGEVFHVAGDAGRVVKLYNAETLRTQGPIYRAKIEAMLERPVSLSPPPKPANSPIDGDIVQLAWPLAVAEGRSRGSFLGFAMPALELQHSDVLESMMQDKLARRRGLRSDLGTRLVLAHNLCAIVSSIHAKGHAIVDLKPQNIQFYKAELYVAILDCDGFHVDVPGGEAPQVTPGYCAPEFIGRRITSPEGQDRFALAVIVFRLLNFGTHPYDGVAVEADVPNETADRIRANLFAHGTVPGTRIRPRPNSTHLCVPADIRSLFDRAFGAVPSLRPSAAEWQRCLCNYADHTRKQLVPCGAGHLRFADGDCPACLRSAAMQAAHEAAPPETRSEVGTTPVLKAVAPPKGTPRSSIHLGGNSGNPAGKPTGVSPQKAGSSPGQQIAAQLMQSLRQGQSPSSTARPKKRRATPPAKSSDDDLEAILVGAALLVGAVGLGLHYLGNIGTIVLVTVAALGFGESPKSWPFWAILTALFLVFGGSKWAWDYVLDDEPATVNEKPDKASSLHDHYPARFRAISPGAHDPLG